MPENLFYVILAILVIVLLVVAAQKIKVAYPVLLVLVGLGVSLIPSMPDVTIDPELIFFIFLPPLLYEAAWEISWKELWKWRRIITSFAFLVVFFSAMSVAFVANYFIPGFSLALGFLLGAIVSPPDAVSASSVLKFVKVPRRIESILSGESLLNDASSLIIFKFALIAVATGQFIWYKAAGDFAWMVFGGAGVGLLIAFLFMKLRRWLPTDTNTDVLLSVITPYSMYMAAEEIHASGVLAVVCGGVLLSYNVHHFTTSSTRLKGVNVWQSFCFALNGIVFIMIGLGLPQITQGLGNVKLSTAIWYGVLITIVLVVWRIIMAYSAVLVTMVAKNFIKVADASNPGWKGPLIIGWAGMRGVLSLAALLSIPVALEDGTPFPQRNLIMFISFVVIVLTLVGQGLTLPLLIKKLDVEDPDEVVPAAEVEESLQKQLKEVALNHLQNNYGKEMEAHPFILSRIKKWEQEVASPDYFENKDHYKKIFLDLLQVQRRWLMQHNKNDDQLDEKLVRKHIRRIDLEEAKLEVEE